MVVGGVSPQRMIECVWRRSFDDAIDSDIVMTLLGRLIASVLMLMSVCCMDGGRIFYVSK